ncbi:MAG TPA: DUF2934 domain-containing protein [Dehalococcoidales bacterium]|nr:DUF2934 domain-containing protein [Dehalococcoidales bacterium]
MGREDEIRLIAYKIWEDEGCQNGRDCEHWLRAETIWELNQKKDVPEVKSIPEKPVKAPVKPPKMISKKKKH